MGGQGQGVFSAQQFTHLNADHSLLKPVEWSPGLESTKDSAVTPCQAGSVNLSSSAIHSATQPAQSTEEDLEHPANRRSRSRGRTRSVLSSAIHGPC